MSLPHVKITAAAHYIPELVLTNEELVQRFGFSVTPEWIFSRTGIRSRHWLPAHLTTSDMAADVGRQLLAEAGVAARDVDRLVLSTISSDHPYPATATIVARKLDLRCMAFDVAAACAGFVYALELGFTAIRSGASQRVLVIASETRSRVVDPRDHRTTVLLADGAAGVLLEASDEPGFVSVVCSAEGHENMAAWVPAGGATLPTSAETVEQRLHYVQIVGSRHIFDEFVGHTLDICGQALDRAGCSIDDVDVFLTHQGNAHLVAKLALALGVPPERAIDNIEHHGNLASAALPMALSECLADGRIKPGQTVLISSVGAGSAFGAAVYRT